MNTQLTPGFLRSFRARLVVGLLLLLGSGLLAACSREALPSMEAGLVGEWEWQQTVAGQQVALTPATTGHQMSIHFDHRGRARFYRDGLLVSAATFTVRADGSSPWGSGRNIIAYQGYRDRQFYQVVGNELRLQDATDQPAEHRYQRVERNIFSSQIDR